MTKTVASSGRGPRKSHGKIMAHRGPKEVPVRDKRPTGAPQEERLIRRAVKQIVRIHGEALRDLEKY